MLQGVEGKAKDEEDTVQIYFLKIFQNYIKYKGLYLL